MKIMTNYVFLENIAFPKSIKVKRKIFNCELYCLETFVSVNFTNN